ncbi:MAG TPA: tyrosine-type recombinase/integrase [Acidimicrobiales bacterium]|nr:tyrosine-type recombinase/integrase [Acidimicrobiales bacterium]
MTIRKLSPATMKAYQADLAAVTRLLPARDGPWMVDELVGPVLRTAFAAFAADHAPASVARARSTWTALFDLLVADDQLDGSPMAAVPRPRQPPRAPKPLLGWDKDTVERLVASVLAGERAGRTVWPELDRVVVALLLGTGLRSAELLGLNLGSYETAVGDAAVRVIGKGSKPRTVPVPQPLPELIDRYLASRHERFPTWRQRLSHALLVSPPRQATPPPTRRAGGKRLTADQLDYLLRQVLAAAGLGSRKPAGANAHAYRHTYGTLLAAEGTTVALLRGLMGHASLGTTQEYVDSVARDRQAAAAANPALRHLRAGQGR